MAVTINDLAAIGSREAFGAVLAPQGRGYYVTLELLALVWGTMHHNDMVLPSLADAKTVTVERRSHDFARRYDLCCPCNCCCHSVYCCHSESVYRNRSGAAGGKYSAAR